MVDFVGNCEDRPPNILAIHCSNVNREYFVVKILSDSLASVKIKCAKYMCNINDNAVQGCLSEN